MARPNRRRFIQSAALGATALSLTANSYGRVKGANGRIGVAFLGVGGRCMSSHVKIVNHLAKQGEGVAPVAVCDVWDGSKNVDEWSGGRGLYPAAEQTGLKADDKEHVTKDYRRLLDLKEVDVVCVASPDHWHAKMSIDAAAAGKHVYCEKPMTKTIDEAHAVVDAMKKYNKVMTVGVQSMADPTWRKANELITSGGIGHVAQAQTSYYRNSDMGQWRYYKLVKEMTPQTVDWDAFLGHGFSVFDGTPLGPKIPFDRAVYGQWRCYWPFGGGMFTDLFVHQTTHMIAAMGVRYPRRVVGAGGLYLEYDGRDVPDVSCVVADYDEGCQFMVTATMIASYPIEEVIRGHLAAVKFVKGGFQVIKDPPKGSPGIPARLEKTVEGEFHPCADELIATRARLPKDLQGNYDTIALWQDFLKCVRAGNRETLSTPELGAAAFTTVTLGVQSYRQGKALFWDKEQRKAVEADASWAEKWEKRSKERGKPAQVAGWNGGDAGSLLHPPEYMKLGGPWTDGKDPAGASTGG